jgi:hypothetical protein
MVAVASAVGTATVVDVGNLTGAASAVAAVDGTGLTVEGGVFVGWGIPMGVS